MTAAVALSHPKRPTLTPANRPSLLFVFRRKLNASCFELDEASRLRDSAATATVDQLWEAIEWAERRIRGGAP